jgi:hypothetical protein
MPARDVATDGDSEDTHHYGNQARCDDQRDSDAKQDAATQLEPRQHGRSSRDQPLGEQSVVSYRLSDSSSRVLRQLRQRRHDQHDRKQPSASEQQIRHDLILLFGTA